MLTFDFMSKHLNTYFHGSLGYQIFDFPGTTQSQDFCNVLKKFLDVRIAKVQYQEIY